MSGNGGGPSRFGDLITRSGEAGAALITAKAQSELARTNPDAYVALQKTQLAVIVIVIIIMVFMYMQSVKSMGF